MVAKLVAMVIGGFVCLKVLLAVIPMFTDLDLQPIEGSGIVYDLMGVAIWLLPVCAIGGVLIWGANSISRRMRGSRSDDEDA